MDTLVKSSLSLDALVVNIPDMDEEQHGYTPYECTRPVLTVHQYIEGIDTDELWCLYQLLMQRS